MLQELINKLNETMSAIQSLQLQPTEHNCSRIIGAINAMRDAAQIAVEMGKAAGNQEEQEDETPAVTEEEI